MSASIGGVVWAATGSPFAVPAAIGVGVFIDSDHVLDWLDSFLGGKTPRRMLVLFHGWEYTAIAFVVLAFWYHPIFLAAILGHMSHMVLDQLGNKATHPLSYSILYRISRRFNHKELVPRYHRRMEHPPYWAKLETFFWRIFAMLRIR